VIMLNLVMRTLILSIAALLAVPVSVYATEPDVAAYAETSQIARASRIESLRKQLATYRNRREMRRRFATDYSATRWDFPDQKPSQSQYIAGKLRENDRYIKSLEESLARLENPLEPYYYDARPTTIGDIGMLARDVRVLQVIDGSNALIEALTYTSGERRVSVPLRNNRAQSVVVGGPPRESARVLWLSGVPTNSFEDGRPVVLQAHFTIVGNKTYETELGSNTVLEVAPFDITPHADLFTRRSELRMWTFASGHTTEAIYVRYQRGTVTLMNLDGTTSDVKLSELSDADRDYVKRRLTASSTR
jgi:hypothetical protein